MIEEEILINKYGQGLLSNEILLNKFSAFDLDNKNKFLNKIIYLIMQSKAKDEDINPAIAESNLKSTYTPCVLLSKGVANSNLLRIISLPENELNKAFILLLSLFKIAYQRRFKEEKDNPNKWWYWDLSDEKNIQKIIKAN
jgi:hypothetical protein